MVYGMSAWQYLATGRTVQAMCTLCPAQMGVPSHWHSTAPPSVLASASGSIDDGQNNCPSRHHGEENDEEICEVNLVDPEHHWMG